MKYTILVSVVLILSLGCGTTCPPCVPIHEITEVVTPIYQCPEPPTLPGLTLPALPVLPDAATDAQRKQWYVDMVQTVNVRIDILRERVDALNAMIEAYREPAP